VIIVGWLDRLLGRDTSSTPPPQAPGYGRPGSRQGYGQDYYAGGQEYGRSAGRSSGARSEDEIAVERYRYLLRTAPPEAIEQVHAEAFAKLTPEQRRQVFDELSSNAPAGDRPRGDDPQSLAQAATRSELRQPGTLERSFGGGGYGRSGPGFGSMLGASLLGTVAGYVVASALVSAFIPDNVGYDDSAAGDAGSEDSGDAGADSGDAGGDAGADVGGGGDFGGGFGDFGGGFGDFGGGDFGGGDFGGGGDF
jgi:hypothetical protein